MGSSPSKTKPGGRVRNRRPPAKKPPPRKDTKKTTFKDAENVGSNDYYTLEMVNGHNYDARDAFLDEQLYPTSDPFPSNPTHANDDYYEPSNRNFPQLRPQREIAQEPDTYREPWEPDRRVPYTNAPPRPLRNLEAKEGHVTDDVISVQVEPESKAISTQTEPPAPYHNRWPEERRIRERHYHRVPVPLRVPPPLPQYVYHRGNYRSQSQLYHVPHDRGFPPRHTSLSEQPEVSDRQRHNHTAVQSLIPHRRDVVIPANPSVVSPQDNVIPHQIAVPQRVSTMPPADLAVSPRVSAMPTQASVIPQSESVIPYQESVKPPRESARVPHESVIIQHVYLPPRSDANLRFYRNEIRFRPDGVFIDDVHRHWYGDYDRLENDHTYIQWLFPLPEGNGTNPEAQPLKQHEIEAMMRDRQVNRRLLKSYMLMLDFYGISLNNREFGKLQRAENYRSRFVNLNNSIHNYHRITRIIKSIGLLGLKHYQLPFVMFLLNEVLVTRLLSNVRDSNLEHWIDAVSDAKDKEAALTFYIDLAARRQHNKGDASQVTSFPGENKNRLPDESMVFSERRDYEDVDDDFTDTTLPLTKSYTSVETDGLTEIPPLNLGLLRRSP